MKPGQSGQNGKQRSRGRSINGGGKKHLPPRNQTYDSNGPDIRIRGNAHQVLEKYLAMARDASSQGDRVSAENFYQHAEHYFRVINNQNQSNGRQPLRAMPADDQDSAGNEGEGEGEDREAGSEDEETEGGDEGQVEEAANV
jgi:hypothetical protein